MAWSDGVDHAGGVGRRSSPYHVVSGRRSGTTIINRFREGKVIPDKYFTPSARRRRRVGRNVRENLSIDQLAAQLAWSAKLRPSPQRGHIFATGRSNGSQYFSPVAGIGVHGAIGEPLRKKTEQWIFKAELDDHAVAGTILAAMAITSECQVDVTPFYSRPVLYPVRDL